MKVFVFKVNRYLYRLFEKLAIGKNDYAMPLGLEKFEKDASYIPGMVSAKEARVLFTLSSPQGIEGEIEEIGSWLGKSTVFLGKGCEISKNGRVNAVDTFEGNPGKTSYQSPLGVNETIYSKFLSNVRKLNMGRYVKPYKMESQEAFKKLKGTYRIVFIDGCHDYKAVKEDLGIWRNKVKKNGLLLMHDYNENFPGVVRAIKEEIINNKSFKSLFSIDSLFVARKIK